MGQPWPAARLLTVVLVPRIIRLYEGAEAWVGLRKGTKRHMANPTSATSAQLAQLQRARELAREKRIVIVGEGFDASRGVPYFVTSSYSSPHLVHHVYIYADRLECLCPRSDPAKGNTICTHRAVAHDELVRRQFMARASARAGARRGNGGTREHEPAAASEPLSPVSLLSMTRR